MPPTVQPLQNKTITEGGNLNLSCNASGTPPLVVSWERISSGQQFDVSLLQLTNVNRSQAGDYRCEARNDCGTKSSTATIHVKCKCILSYTCTVESRLMTTPFIRPPHYYYHILFFRPKRKNHCIMYPVNATTLWPNSGHINGFPL